jgi:hypothetical protein
MRLFRILHISVLALVIFSSAAIAGDFSWTKNFNIQAKADPQEFRAKLAARFNLSDMQVIALRNIFPSPADAYIMLRLGEMQGVLQTLTKEQGIEAVKKYRSNKCKGWDVLAESLGVEAGSEEFLALKSGHDLHTNNNSDHVASSSFDRGNASF